MVARGELTLWELMKNLRLVPLVTVLICSCVSMPKEMLEDLRIVTPKDGTIVAPGQRINIIVSVKKGVSFEIVGIDVEDTTAPGFSGIKDRIDRTKDRPPYKFSVRIPDTLIGPKKITAFGFSSPDTEVMSQSVTIDIETPAKLIGMEAIPKELEFVVIGQHRSINVRGYFADGDVLDITESTRIKYSSNDDSMTTVDTRGQVTVVEHGPIGVREISTEIVVSFGDKSIVVPVIIRPMDNVTIDIKPGSYPNNINLGSGGTVPVAILSTADFDATTVDPLTVTLASAPVKLKGKGKSMVSSQDVNGDGRLDLVVQVETEVLELTPTSKKAILDGKTFSGMAIRGSDSIRVVP